MADDKYKILQDTLIKQLGEKLEQAKSQEEKIEILKEFDEIALNKLPANCFISLVDSYNSMVDAHKSRADANTKHMRNTMYKQVIIFRPKEQEFLAQQEKKWCEAFVASESMYIMTLNAAESYLESVKKLPQEDLKSHHFKFKAMLQIHGRALQQFLEITTLMKNGFADGAYARWRSMYELAVISSFLVKYGEKVAEAFIKSAETEDHYEWARASGAFSEKKKRIYFKDIQKECNINFTAWRNCYAFANIIIHPSSKGTFARLSNIGEQDFIPVGRSDFRITTPAEHSAISLAQITAMFFTIFEDDNALLATLCIANWIHIIRETYFKTHDSLFPDKKKLWDDSLVSYEDETNSIN